MDNLKLFICFTGVFVYILGWLEWIFCEVDDGFAVYVVDNLLVWVVHGLGCLVVRFGALGGCCDLWLIFCVCLVGALSLL